MREYLANFMPVILSTPRFTCRFRNGASPYIETVTSEVVTDLGDIDPMIIESRITCSHGIEEEGKLARIVVFQFYFPVAAQVAALLRCSSIQIDILIGARRLYLST